VTDVFDSEVCWLDFGEGQRSRW